MLGQLLRGPAEESTTNFLRFFARLKNRRPTKAAAVTLKEEERILNSLIFSGLWIANACHLGHRSYSQSHVRPASGKYTPHCDKHDLIASHIGSY